MEVARGRRGVVTYYRIKTADLSYCSDLAAADVNPFEKGIALDPNTKDMAHHLHLSTFASSAFVTGFSQRGTSLKLSGMAMASYPVAKMKGTPLAASAWATG